MSGTAPEFTVAHEGTGKNVREEGVFRLTFLRSHRLSLRGMTDGLQERGDPRPSGLKTGCTDVKAGYSDEWCIGVAYPSLRRRQWAITL